MATRLLADWANFQFIAHSCGGGVRRCPLPRESRIASPSGCLVPAARFPHGPEAGFPCKTESQAHLTFITIQYKYLLKILTKT